MIMQPEDDGGKTEQCRRCGTCCIKGGPAFHAEDRHLIEKGLIHTRFLYTIRRGELARDNLHDRLMPQRTDVIKIKGQGGTWTCHFYDRKNRCCSIYEHRPVECRALKCWDVSEIRALYAVDRLTREDLLGDVEGLWELVRDHQRRCSYRRLGELAGRLNDDDKNAAAEILAIVQYDTELRPPSRQKQRHRNRNGGFSAGTAAHRNHPHVRPVRPRGKGPADTGETPRAFPVGLAH
jgi:Fe-S-cluster containining protein